MNARLRRRLGTLLLVVFAVSGCASADPNLYTIAPVQGAPAPDAPRVILLNNIAVAKYLDRSAIVRSSENYRVAVSPNDWWGEPLPQMLSRVLIEELSERLPGSTVYGENGAIRTRPDATIDLNIQRLDQDASGNVVLLAQADVALTGRRGSANRSVRLTAMPTGPDTAAEVAAMSSVVGRLADSLATMLRAP